MSKLVVEGVLRDDGLKDYRITYEGRTYIAVRSGQLFECSGHRGTIKELKSLILTNGIGQFEPEPSTNSSQQPLQNAWDCVDPCAFLVELLSSPESACYSILTRLPGIHNTLDSYGWLDELGNPDAAKARREFNRVIKKKGVRTGE